MSRLLAEHVELRRLSVPQLWLNQAREICVALIPPDGVVSQLASWFVRCRLGDEALQASKASRTPCLFHIRKPGRERGGREGGKRDKEEELVREEPRRQQGGAVALVWGDWLM